MGKKLRSDNTSFFCVRPVGVFLKSDRLLVPSGMLIYHAGETTDAKSLVVLAQC